MNGAGRYRAQCGLVEGTLMFIGVFGTEKEFEAKKIKKICFDYASLFEQEFGSLTCRDLRPDGFRSDDPEHLCEELTVKSIMFSVKFLSKLL